MLFNGKLQNDVESLISTTNRLSESLNELRETVRRQQFRINELENAMRENRAPMVDASASFAADEARQRELAAAVTEMRKALGSVQERLGEHEQGMRWLYQKLTESGAAAKDSR